MMRAALSKRQTYDRVAVPFLLRPRPSVSCAKPYEGVERKVFP
ncbi:hypothetical protein STXM2123_1799 [Streptomyces sp. F-3]|nr:hypothetical protein STXM2123_1799 [Streptomyces sp. F-3]